MEILADIDSIASVCRVTDILFWNQNDQEEIFLFYFIIIINNNNNMWIYKAHNVNTQAKYACEIITLNN